jgi:cytoskeletal protein CcmA (bactofilin family)
MFKQDKAVGFHSNKTTLISEGTEVNGDLSFEGCLEIEGKINGNITAAEGSQGTVRILEKGVVEGEITAPTVVVNGTVMGNVHSSAHVELAAKAVITGNVNYCLIEMVKGAQINGGLVYSGVQPESINDYGAAAPLLDDRIDEQTGDGSAEPILD